MGETRKILVVGSGSEIAKAIIKKIVNDETTVLTASREDLKEENHYFFDASDSNSIQSLVKKLEGILIDWIIYCPGYINEKEDVENLNIETLELSQKINFFSAITLINALTKNLTMGGGVVCLSSTAGIWGNKEYPVYAMWKGALNTFLQSLNKQWTEKGIHAFALCPGPTNTAMRERVAGDASVHQSPEVVAKYIEKIIKQPERFSETPILVVQNNTLYALTQKLEELEVA